MKKALKITLGIAGYTVLLAALYFGWKSGSIEQFIRHAGILAPALYILIATAKAVFPIIPGEVLVISGVVFFGPVLGFLYALIGLTLGSALAFLLARRFGTPFVKWLMGEKRFEKVHHLAGDKTLFTFFLIYLAPGTPDDFVTYIAGLTSLPIYTFLIICVLGRLPSYLIYLLGGVSLVSLNFKLMIFWWLVMFLVVGALFIFKRYMDHKKNYRKTSKNA